MIHHDSKYTLSHISRKVILITVIFSVLLFNGCSRNREPVSQTGFAFNTVITISIYEDTKIAQPLLTECFQKCTAYENLLSRTVENSDIWNINHADGKAVEVSDTTISLVQTALEYAKMSDGTIDLTIGPLSESWNFSEQAGSDNPIVPSQSIISEQLKHVNYKNVSISGNTIALNDPDAALDLGFLAKGYIADQLKSYLVSEGIKSGIINLGGNVLTIGSKPDGSTFTIGIQKPFDEMNTALFVLPVSDSSIVSSGCYERFFYKNDKLYHHILDTNTGYPVDNNLYSVTILSKSSTIGDALSTYCYSLGLTEGIKLIEATPDVEAVFVTNTYEIYKTSGV